MQFHQYVVAAFNAKPRGMLFPPNWALVGAFGLLGILNPGFWLVGAGVELAYLLAMVTNARFRRLVEGVEDLAAKLGEEDRERLAELDLRCAAALKNEPGLAAALDALRDAYLQLLLTRAAIVSVLREDPETDRTSLERDLREVQRRARNAEDRLRDSLVGQADVLERRLAAWKAAESKLEIVATEISRIEDQVELLREQAVLEHDPAVTARRVDEVSASLGKTHAWLEQQRAVYGLTGASRPR
ncbi:MAG: hypothetical protein ACOZNI_26890 [Myxococcota bacterium]